MFLYEVIKIVALSVLRHIRDALATVSINVTRDATVVADWPIVIRAPGVSSSPFCRAR